MMARGIALKVKATYAERQHKNGSLHNTRDKQKMDLFTLISERAGGLL